MITTRGTDARLDTRYEVCTISYYDQTPLSPVYVKNVVTEVFVTESNAIFFNKDKVQKHQAPGLHDSSSTHEKHLLLCMGRLPEHPKP